MVLTHICHLSAHFQSCLSLDDILDESGDHHVELDGVLGSVLYHVLRGDCVRSHVLPEQQYFLDYIFSHFGSDNLTLHGMTDDATLT